MTVKSNRLNLRNKRILFESLGPGTFTCRMVPCRSYDSDQTAGHNVKRFRVTGGLRSSLARPSVFPNPAYHCVSLRRQGSQYSRRSVQTLTSSETKLFTPKSHPKGIKKRYIINDRLSVLKTTSHIIPPKLSTSHALHPWAWQSSVPVQQAQILHPPTPSQTRQPKQQAST